MVRKYNALLILAAFALLVSGCGDDTSISSIEDNGQLLSSAIVAPPGGVFESATLNIFVAGVNGQPVNVHRITAPWEEMVVTYNSFGGAFDGTVHGTFLADAFAWRTVDVSTLVGGWIAGDYENYGLLLDQVELATPRAGYPSREADNRRPFLEICWSTPGGQVCEVLPPLGDTYIWGFDPDVNNGARPVLYTGWGWQTDIEKQTMLQFEVPDVPVEYGDCEGKVTQLTLQYNGGLTDAHVVVVQKRGAIPFDGIVQPGEQFTFTGLDRKGTLGPEIDIYVNGEYHIFIHTSCSQPIGPGLVRGDFTVIEGYSRRGGLLAPVAPDAQD